MNKTTLLLILLGVIILAASSSLYTVTELEKAVKLEFGKVVEADIKPGLHIKMPIMHEIRKFDGRILTLDSRPERYLTVEQKPLIVDSYAKWRVSDVERYYTRTNGEESRAAQLLSQRITTGLRNKFGERTQHEVVSGERDQLMKDLTHDLNEIALSDLGVEVIDIRVKRIDLPPEVSGSVYNRMNTAREREAREHRSKGKELAEAIRADADRQKIILEAEAYREGEKARGEGDAIASATYAEAFSLDAEFYAFTRSLNAYKEVFSQQGDLMVVKPDSEFFRYLKSSVAK